MWPREDERDDAGGGDRHSAPDRAEIGQPAVDRGPARSSRGAGGGVRLARPPASISLADIVEAVEGPIQMTTCVDSERHECALEGACQVRPHMGVVNGAVRGALAAVSLAQLSSSRIGA